MKTQPTLRIGARIYAEWYEDGQRKTKRCPPERSNDPQAWFAEWTAPKRAELYLILEKALPLVARRPGTKGSYGVALKRAERFKPDGVWKKSDVRAFASQLMEEGLATTSVLTYVGALNGMAAEAEAMDWLDGNPFRVKMRLPKTERKRFGRITSEQADAVIERLETDDPDAALLCRFVRGTFVRPGELERLDDTHVNIEARTITVPGAHAKTRKDGVSVLPSDLARTLQARKEAGLPLVPKNVERLSKHVTQAMAALGLPKTASLYSFKHVGVLELLNRTTDMHLVKMQCRHTSVASTEAYLHSRPSDALMSLVG